MLSPRKTRAPKRRIDELDHRIECLTKVINKIRGCERSYFDLKLMGVQLRKQKLISLTSFAHTQKMQTILAELDFLVAENDLNVEIEAIMNCKKFRSSEEFLRRREKRSEEDPDSTEIIETISGHSTPKRKRRNMDRASLSQKMPNISDSDDDKENNPFVDKSKDMNHERTNKATSKNKNDAITKQKLRISRTLFGRNKQRIINDEKNTCLVKDSDRKIKDNVWTLNEKYISSSNSQNNKNEPTAITQKESKKEHVKKRAKPSLKSKDSTNDPINDVIAKARPTSQRKVEALLNTSKSIAPNKETHKIQTDKEIRTEATPEAKGTHKNVINLYRTYKKIYSPEVSTANKIKLSNENACTTSNKENTDVTNQKVLDKVIKISECMANITDRLKKIQHSKDSSKVTEKPSRSDKMKDNATLRNSKSDNLEKPRRKHTKRKGLAGPNPPKPVILKKNIIDLDDEQVIFYMNEMVNKSCDEESLEMEHKLEENVVTVATEEKDRNQNDTMNSIIYDLLSKQVKIEEISSDKMTSCSQCGPVYEGHMCAYTIRELLEQC